MGDAGQAEGLESGFRRARFLVRVDARVDPLLADLRGDRPEDPVEAIEGHAFPELAEVLTVGLEDPELRRMGGEEVPLRDEARDGFGHPAYDTEVPRVAEEALVQDLGDLGFGRAGGPCVDAFEQRALIHREQELLEAHRPQVQVLDAAHRHAVLEVGEGEFEQGARGDHRGGGGLFVKVAEAREDLGGCLDLVEKKQRVFS
jgi:hypothetical protein